MYYNLIKMPALIRTGRGIVSKIDDILREHHFFFPKRVLITQEELYGLYGSMLDGCAEEVVFVKGGKFEEAPELLAKLTDKNALLLAFGGGSVLDLVKYCASKRDLPYVNIPSALSNDAVYSCLARLTDINGKKRSLQVQPPLGIIVDFDFISRSPRFMSLAGMADIVSNLSACEDWLLANHQTGERINEVAFMLAKQAALPLFDHADDVGSDGFFFDLTNGIVTSGLSTIVNGDTRGVSGSEHLISHAIDEFFPERATLHGLQVGWAHLYIEKYIRKNEKESERLETLFTKTGLMDVIREKVQWKDEELPGLIPYAMKIRKRYTIFNTL